MPKLRKNTCWVPGIVLTGLGAAWLIAGPLDPPVGPVSPTHKTLTEVEPRIAINAVNTPGDADSLFKITQPGSYYLTGNVTGVSGKHGIEIAASGVTIDLNGFDLAGVPSMGNVDGISASATNLSDIDIRNGSVRNWGDDGVDLGSRLVRNAIITGVRSSSNGGHGISGGGGCVIRECAAYENQFYGFDAYHNATLDACTAEGNASSGYRLGLGSTMSQCAAEGNVGGIATDDGCTIIGCSAASNSSHGIATSHGCTVSGCSAQFNGGDGIRTEWRCTVVDCSAANNTDDGIVTGSGCSIRGCNVYDNSNGISAGSGCVVSSNTANSQTLDGIRVNGNCLVSGNGCFFNGAGITIGAGIHATGDGNRIEANACNGNDFGIDIDGNVNVIIKNTCADNTQAFVIASDNLYGPIFDRRIPAAVPSTPPVAGFSAAGTMGSTDTNANFAH